MLADLAVLSQDVFCVPVDALSATHSVLTLVGGRIVHDAGMLTKSARRRPADRREWARRGTVGVTRPVLPQGHASSAPSVAREPRDLARVVHGTRRGM
jgi:hypothetical protein